MSEEKSIIKKIAKWTLTGILAASAAIGGGFALYERSKNEDLAYENKIISIHNHNLSTQNEDLKEQNNNLLTNQNQDLLDAQAENSNLIDINENLIDKNKNLKEENKELSDVLSDFQKFDISYKDIIFRLINNKGEGELVAVPSATTQETLDSVFFDLMQARKTKVITIKNYAFKYCSNLEYIRIPYSVTKIGEYAFFNCSSLQSVTIPDNLENIQFNAFKGCDSLKEVRISSTLMKRMEEDENLEQMIYRAVPETAQIVVEDEMEMQQENVTKDKTSIKNDERIR